MFFHTAVPSPLISYKTFFFILLIRPPDISPSAHKSPPPETPYKVVEAQGLISGGFTVLGLSSSSSSYLGLGPFWSMKPFIRVNTFHYIY